MADDEHPKSNTSENRRSIASAPAEDVRSQRMSGTEFPAEHELASARQSRASEPGPITFPLEVADHTEIPAPGQNEEAADEEPKSPGTQSRGTLPKSPGAISAKSASAVPKSPGTQSIKTLPKSPRQSVISQPRSPSAQSVKTQPKSPRLSVIAPPKSPKRQSVTAPPKSPRAESVAAPTSPEIQQAVSPPNSPGIQIATAPSDVLTSAPPPAVMAPPESPGKQSTVILPKSPGTQSVAAPPKSPTVVSASQQMAELTSIEPEVQQPQPVAMSPVPQITEVLPTVTSVPLSEPVVEPSEYVGSQIAQIKEGEEQQKEPEGTEVEEVQDAEKAELVVKDVLFEITGLESISFQGYMGSLGDFLCTNCKTAIYTYWKTPCNHQFCEKCKDGAVSEDTFTCLVEGTQMNLSELEEVIIDLNKLKEAEVFCLNKSQGCKEKFPIKDIKDHLEECYYTFFPCPQNCGETTIRKELGKHLTEECERRVYLCEMCETDVQEVERTTHDDVCEKKAPPSNCEFCGMGPIEREDMEKHYLDCVHKPRPCRMSSIGCTFVGTKEETDCHENFDNHRDIIMVFIQDQKETVMNLEQEKNETKLQLSEALGKLQNIDLINRYLAVKVGILEEVPYVQKEMEEENKFLKQKVEDLLNRQLTHEEQICRMTEYCAGRPFEWIINGYSMKKEAEKNEGGRQCSPPFYISYSGYRVRLIAYLNGNGEGKGTHLTIYYCVMKGANDAVLDWPFKQKVTLRLVDRKFGTPLLKKVVEPKSFTLGDDSFQRPAFEENVGRGYPKFINHEELEAIDSRYLLKDSIIIAAEFEPAEVTE